MVNAFLFSKNHIVIMLVFAVFLYVCPWLTKNLLPYSYIVEKVICGLILLEIVFEQFSIISMGNYDVLTNLPISISRFTAYICIAILFFKQYQLFNVFFAWSLVCCIGEIVFFPAIPYRYPNILYVLSVISKCLLIYANVYLFEVRKFKINSSALKSNLAMFLMYFPALILLNLFTSADYSYCFSSHSLWSIAWFFLATNLVYLVNLIYNGGIKKART